MQRTQKPDFTYQDFASQFTCELFNATEWAEIFADSGAKYVVLTSKHHEGFTLYPSTYSFSWNSMDVGPNRNIIKELSDAVREKSLKFGIYYSLFEWFNRMYIDDKFHGFLQQNYVNHKMFPELQEIVKLFRPEVIWSDGEWEAPDEYWRAKEFLAWLYNESPVHETVVANDRWGISTLCRHGDVYTCTDRYNPGVLQKHKFENAMTIDKKSWGHRDDAKLSDFFSSEELIKEIVSTIAINGNILINVGPTKYGTIEAIFADRLRDMGKWLKINGKGIYGSRPWVYQRDGNTTWFTMNAGEKRDSVFVFVTDYPYDTNTIVIGKVGKFMDKSSKIFMLGYDEELEVKFNKFSLRMYFKLNYLISVPIYKFT
jgi:alpha-L-fucosidase